MERDMWKRIKDKYNQLDLRLLTIVVYGGFLMCLFAVTLLICLESPVQSHFKELAKTDVWFGEGWSYVTSETDRTGSDVEARNSHYLRVQKQGDATLISKVFDFTPEEDEYLCFRVKAQDVSVYVNDELIYHNSYKEEYRDYAKHMYLFHQIPVGTVRENDTVTISLSSEEADFFNLQFVAVGDRYALTRYILKKCSGTLAACVVALVLIIICVVVSSSPVFTEKERDAKALHRLAVFLALAVVYLSMDSGCMELFIERTSVVSWFNSVSMLMLPIPFILFTESAFFPGQKRYELLALTNLIICAVSVICYMLFAVSMVSFFIYVHILIALDIAACVLSFIEERMKPAAEIVTGFGSVMLTALASIIAYWKGILVPASILFGYGLLIFSACMLVWIMRNRYELNSMRSEVDHMLVERKKKVAEEASEQKSRFLSHMSHEIRTQLNAMLGMNELIMHETDRETIMKYTENIQSAGRTLLALINDVLDFSKIETGKMDIVETNYSLSSVLNDVVLMVQGKADDKGLELRLDVDGQIPDMLRGDEIRIKQVILNLMSNAVKDTNEGWVELSVRMKSASGYLDDENVTLIVRVSDSGIGIREEEKAGLFKEFERLDQKKNRSIEGSGLGLSIASRLVQYMNGRISVDSVYGKGSTFIMEVPQRVVSLTAIGDYKKRFELLSSEHAKQQEQQEESLENMRFTGKSVLTVDDNEMNLEVIASILEMLDITVEKAGGGREAIACLDRERFDLILTDDMMPEIDGKQVLSYLQSKEDNPNHDVPIVVLTANAVAGARDEYMELGFDAYMTKPIDIDVLQKILIKYLK